MNKININENNMSEYEYETFIDNYVKSLKIDYQKAKLKKDYDFILKKFNIKVKKKDKLYSALPLNIDMKKHIIQFKINEPEDVFHLDIYKKKIDVKEMKNIKSTYSS